MQIFIRIEKGRNRTKQNEKNQEYNFECSLNLVYDITRCDGVRGEYGQRAGEYQ